MLLGHCPLTRGRQGHASEVDQPAVTEDEGALRTPFKLLYADLQCVRDEAIVSIEKYDIPAGRFA